MYFFALAAGVALATVVHAEVTSTSSSPVPFYIEVDRALPAIFETYGVCQSDNLTTVPLTVAATTTTVTTTLPLTTTVSVYPGVNRARDVLQAEFTPFPKRAGELEQRDITEIHSWVCTETVTEVCLHLEGRELDVER